MVRVHQRFVQVSITKYNCDEKLAGEVANTLYFYDLPHHSLFASMHCMLEDVKATLFDRLVDGRSPANKNLLYYYTK